MVFCMYLRNEKYKNNLKQTMPKGYPSGWLLQMYTTHNYNNELNVKYNNFFYGTLIIR